MLKIFLEKADFFLERGWSGKYDLTLESPASVEGSGGYHKSEFSEIQEDRWCRGGKKAVRKKMECNCE